MKADPRGGKPFRKGVKNNDFCRQKGTAGSKPRAGTLSQNGYGTQTSARDSWTLFLGKAVIFSTGFNAGNQGAKAPKNGAKIKEKKPRNEHLENSMTAFSSRSSAGNQGAKAPKNGAKKEPVREFHVTEK